MSAESKCGTYAGWNIHKRKGEKACDACRQAATEYQRSWRARGGEAVERQAAMNRAREAALWRLKDLHRDHFDLLVADEMRVEKARMRTDHLTALGGDAAQ